MSENCVSMVLNNERVYTAKYIDPVNSPFSILIFVAIFARGVSLRINSIRNNSKQESTHVQCVTEKKMMPTQQYAWNIGNVSPCF